MATDLCNHIKANGTCCESPALRDNDYCYFHAASRQRIKRQRRQARLRAPLEIPILEDAESIQLAIGDVLNALLAGQIDLKTAGLVLYGLQTAAGNVRHVEFNDVEENRVYDQYNDDEQESLEEEIAEEIEEERKPESHREAAQSPVALPPKKSAEPARESGNEKRRR